MTTIQHLSCMYEGGRCAEGWRWCGVQLGDGHQGFRVWPAEVSNSASTKWSCCPPLLLGTKHAACLLPVSIRPPSGGGGGGDAKGRPPTAVDPYHNTWRNVSSSSTVIVVLCWLHPRGGQGWWGRQPEKARGRGRADTRNNLLDVVAGLVRSGPLFAGAVTQRTCACRSSALDRAATLAQRSSSSPAA